MRRLSEIKQSDTAPLTGRCLRCNEPTEIPGAIVDMVFRFNSSLGSESYAQRMREAGTPLVSRSPIRANEVVACEKCIPLERYDREIAAIDAARRRAEEWKARKVDNDG
jgi:hypothetical protein